MLYLEKEIIQNTDRFQMDREHQTASQKHPRHQRFQGRSPKTHNRHPQSFREDLDRIACLSTELSLARLKFEQALTVAENHGATSDQVQLLSDELRRLKTLQLAFGVKPANATIRYMKGMHAVFFDD